MPGYGTVFVFILLHASSCFAQTLMKSNRLSLLIQTYDSSICQHFFFFCGWRGSSPKKWKCKIRSFLSIAGNFMCCKKAAQGLSEEKAFVCFALVVHKASEMIVYRDHQSCFFLLRNTSHKTVVWRCNYEWLHPNGV